jgi:hypothetical protein
LARFFDSGLGRDVTVISFESKEVLILIVEKNIKRY